MASASSSKKHVAKKAKIAAPEEKEYPDGFVKPSGEALCNLLNDYNCIVCMAPAVNPVLLPCCMRVFICYACLLKDCKNWLDSDQEPFKCACGHRNTRIHQAIFVADATVDLNAKHFIDLCYPNRDYRSYDNLRSAWRAGVGEIGLLLELEEPVFGDDTMENIIKFILSPHQSMSVSDKFTDKLRFVCIEEESKRASVWQRKGFDYHWLGNTTIWVRHKHDFVSYVGVVDPAVDLYKQCGSPAPDPFAQRLVQQIALKHPNYDRAKINALRQRYDGQNNVLYPFVLAAVLDHMQRTLRCAAPQDFGDENLRVLTKAPLAKYIQLVRTGQDLVYLRESLLSFDAAYKLGVIEMFTAPAFAPLRQGFWQSVLQGIEAPAPAAASSGVRRTRVAYDPDPVSTDSEDEVDGAASVEY